MATVGKTLQAQKKELRGSMAALLKTLQPADLDAQNAYIAEKVLAHPRFLAARSVCFYANPRKDASLIPAEVDCTSILLQALRSGHCSCSIPRIFGDTMIMLQVPSEKSLNSFPLNKWGIPEPPEDSPEAEAPDLILVPGLAFDESYRRLGRGKGFYDSFIRATKARASQAGRVPPFLLGLAFAQQIVRAVPAGDFDERLDELVVGAPACPESRPLQAQPL
mmetsp:Transcript_11517/g.29022  ORF Transcript_11517/g.29022 Transcript_11517/m.29022 type:complete len:221 (-) Transcript_11517:433-1095(-)